MMEKQCSKCREIKPLDEFYCQSSHSSGHQSHCKSCRKAYEDAHRKEKHARAKVYYASHRAEISAKTKAYRQSHREEVLLREQARRANRTPEVRARIKVKQKAWHDANREKYNANRRAVRIANPVKQLLSAAKQRAKRKGIPFAITEKDVTVPSCCPVLGIPLSVMEGRGPHDGSPSLDRIRPELGYVPGNVIVVSWRVNRTRYDASVKELRLIADFYERLLEKPFGELDRKRVLKRILE